MSYSQKQGIRREMRLILSNLDERWLRAASANLCKHLTVLVENVLGKEVEHLLAWVPFFPGEVDLTPFIGEQLGRRKVYLPRSLEDGSMTFISVGEDWLDSSEAGLFGIPEPSDTSGEQFNLVEGASTAVLIPGVAFDSDGGRLGRGKGFYDRFLSKREMKDVTKIGIGWSLQLVDSVPTESNDISMDWVCHERGYLRTGILFDEDDEV